MKRSNSMELMTSLMQLSGTLILIVVDTFSHGGNNSALPGVVRRSQPEGLPPGLQASFGVALSSSFSRQLFT